MSALGWRVAALVLLALMFVGKFVALGPVRQIEATQMSDHLAHALDKAAAENVTEGQRHDRNDAHQFEFSMKDCEAPYLAMQASTLEDLQAVLDHSQPLPGQRVPHVIYLGQELDFADRIGLKRTAVSQFVLFRLGLSPEMPSGDLYIVLAAPGCFGYRTIEWSRIWAV